jgi:hypothetical protein
MVKSSSGMRRVRIETSNVGTRLETTLVAFSWSLRYSARAGMMLARLETLVRVTKREIGI